MKKNLLVIFLIVVILEVTLFNINSYRVLNNKLKKEYVEDDFINIDSNEDYTYFEIDNVNTEIKTVHIELDIAEQVEYEFLYTDKTSSNLRGIPKKTYIQKNENSKYIPCYFSGESSKIGLKVYSDIADIEKVVINEKIPFNFNIARVIVLYGITVFIYLLKTQEIFKKPYSEKILAQEITLIFIVCIFALIVCLISAYSRNLDEKEDFYSKDFIDALSKGQVYLEKKPSEKLMKLDNPYDDGERISNGLLREKDFLWDVAYYKGKYYVYFGILPALCLMLPYHLITGKYISSAVAVLIFSLLTIISIKELIKKLFDKFFKEVPFKFMVFALIMLLFGSQILWLNGIPRFYELSIISALFFAVTGINFMFLSFKENKYLYIFLSSLFLSLAVACRPTQIFTSIILLPVIIKTFVENVKQKKDIVKNILAVLVPYLIVGISLMYYNYIRFENILEFGASYQLTINDMSNLGNRFMTLGVGIICSLFSIPLFLPNFPFLQYHNNLLTFYGYYYIENVMGGLFCMVPICLFIFGIFKIWKRTDDKELFRFTVTLIFVRNVNMFA